MGELTDDHHHGDEMTFAVSKGSFANVVAAHEENMRQLVRPIIDSHGQHACADDDSEDNTPKLGKISPDEAVILMKNMRLGATASGEEYNSKFLARIREILRRLDMPA